MRAPCNSRAWIDCFGSPWPGSGHTMPSAPRALGSLATLMDVGVAYIDPRSAGCSTSSPGRVQTAPTAWPDAKGVHSYLHVPGTPAPNKEAAIKAS
jgi:hypothetical protein